MDGYSRPMTYEEIEKLVSARGIKILIIDNRVYNVTEFINRYVRFPSFRLPYRFPFIGTVEQFKISVKEILTP